MIILLVAYNIYVLVKVILAESPLGSAEVLGDVDGRTVAPQDELAVQAVGGKVAPDAPVRVLDEDPCFKPFLDQFLSEKVGIVLEISLVERDS